MKKKLCKANPVIDIGFFLYLCHLMKFRFLPVLPLSCLIGDIYLLLILLLFLFFCNGEQG